MKMEHTKGLCKDEPLVQYLTTLALVITINILISSCASFGPTIPNLSILDPTYQNPSDANFFEAQIILKDLSTQNVKLAQELGKLPELHDSVDNIDLKTLRDIRNVYQENPKSFDVAFAEMYQVGKPNIRRYCSPLQAFFWLIEEDEKMQINDLISNYSLDLLLNYSWDFKNITDGVFIEIPDEKIDSLINEIKDKKGVYVPGGIANKREIYTKFILYQYFNNRRIYSKDSRSYIEQKIEVNKKNKLWSDFVEVVYRLNSPELIAYYERKNFISTHGGGKNSTPKTIFMKKKGNCGEHSLFTHYCLRKAGYSAYIERVPGRKSHDNHRTTVYELEDKWFVIDVHKMSIRGIRGPFNTKQEALRIYY